MTVFQENTGGQSYNGWLPYKEINNPDLVENYRSLCTNLIVPSYSEIIATAEQELLDGIAALLGNAPKISNELLHENALILATAKHHVLYESVIEPKAFDQLNGEGYIIKTEEVEGNKRIFLIGKEDKGALYAAFHFLRLLQMGKLEDGIEIVENPKNRHRMINQWDNMDGSIERGYAGKSIFYENNRFTENFERIKDYARLLASVGINGISINNVNVFDIETKLITSEFLPDVAKVAKIFREYGITTFLSINYASPIQIGGLSTADPLDPEVKEWWRTKTEEIYQYIPDFGGYLVKADSEHRPGPFSYGRDHAEGANVLAEALAPFNGVIIWRCFVYNCLQDWRDRSTDRAKAAYDNFIGLDGKFLPNVILQIKNGPMDFQVREPVSPLFGAMEKTNQILEFQIAQEYTGQQIDLCYLIPQWKEVMDFDTFAKGEGSTIKRIADGSLFDFQHNGIAAVSNIGNDLNWTGHSLAQANFYGFGRLTWNSELTAEEIAKEWIALSFGHDPRVAGNILNMMMDSWKIYENYTAPLGVGWMINPDHHYGPNVDGYEYSVWGTYHFADRDGIGVDRTVETGTGYAGQYFSPNSELYENIETCPDELLLFFHHVPYSHVLKSGETVIQHIYDTHYKGVEQVDQLKRQWAELESEVDETVFANVSERLERQYINAEEWRDKINTYFYRKAGVPDEQGRKIY